MEKLVEIRGCAAPLLRINIDSEQISPAKYNLQGEKRDFGKSLFGNWRYRPDGAPDPDFILNRSPFDRAVILLADRNFGCGSSGENGPTALRAFGFRALIAPSFGGIFFNNCFRHGMLPVELPIEQVRVLAAQAETGRGLLVDLAQQRVVAPDGQVFAFKTPALLRRMLLEGLDEIGITLSMRDRIDEFWRADRARRPWVHAVSAAPGR